MLNRLIKKMVQVPNKQKKAKTFDSHWYMRFGWLEQPLQHLSN